MLTATKKKTEMRLVCVYPRAREHIYEEYKLSPSSISTLVSLL